MILEIKFSLSGKKQILPLNYYYPLSSWIYKIINNSSVEFARRLHQYGYKTETGKTFKLFTFSNLTFPAGTYKVIKGTDRLEVSANTALLKVAFLLPEQLEHFVKGLFQNQSVVIGDRISQIEMEINGVEIKYVKIPADNRLFFKTVTPVVTGFNDKTKKYEQYISPNHVLFNKLIVNNLIEKYNTYGINTLNENSIHFLVTKIYKNKQGGLKSSLQTIKAFTPQETKVKGYYFEFELLAPSEITEVVIYSGIGSMNSMGFGFCEIMKGE
jgi:CRISPR-associated endoribonuclease Cas6